MRIAILREMLNNHQKDWIEIDARGEVLGRLASRVALILQGKHKPSYVPYQDRGDYVIVKNVEKVVVTGNKMEQKMYYRHSQYPGGLKALTMKQMFEKDPARVFYLAVKNMLPKNRLAARMLKKLRVYPGEEHPHRNHNPRPMQPTLR